MRLFLTFTTVAQTEAKKKSLPTAHLKILATHKITEAGTP